MAFQSHQNQKALDTLEGLRTLKKISADFQLRATDIRANALEALNHPVESIQERVLLDTLLGDPEKIVANQKAIWATLMKLSPHTLKWIHIDPAPNVFGGWVALAYLAQQYASDPEQLSEAIAAWKKSYPTHPAQALLATFVPTIIEPEKPTVIAPPKKIALLLPLSGPYQGVSETIRDGFMTAYYRAKEKPTLRVYDTTQKSSVRKIYAEALDDGAEMVIGPLTKDEVKQMADMSDRDITVPTLMLNTPEKGTLTAPNLMAFSLAPELEGGSLASRLKADHMPQIGLLVSSTAQSGRIQTAFEQVFSDNRILGTATVHPEEDASGAIRQLLHIDASLRRHAELKRLLSTALQSQPRRRQDVDALVLVASADEARQWRPLLDFYYAGNLPVYAASGVYSGQPNLKRDGDMNRILFCDMPWLIQPNHPLHATYQTLQSLWPDKADTDARLFAFGLDAYQLTTELQHLPYFASFGFLGATGKLYKEDSHTVGRQLAWAKIQNGAPKWLGF
jgi:outer membrane PBP1 activator LpoA protein